MVLLLEKKRLLPADYMPIQSNKKGSFIPGTVWFSFSSNSLAFSIQAFLSGQAEAATKHNITNSTFLKTFAEQVFIYPNLIPLFFPSL
jgi:hypothetical protein